MEWNNIRPETIKSISSQATKTCKCSYKSTRWIDGKIT